MRLLEIISTRSEFLVFARNAIDCAPISIGLYDIGLIIRFVGRVRGVVGWFGRGWVFSCAGGFWPATGLTPL